MDVETDFPDGGKLHFGLDEVSILHFRSAQMAEPAFKYLSEAFSPLREIFPKNLPGNWLLAMITRRQAVTPMLIVNSPVSEQFRLPAANELDNSKARSSRPRTYGLFIYWDSLSIAGLQAAPIARGGFTGRS